MNRVILIITFSIATFSISAQTEKVESLHKQMAIPTIAEKLKTIDDPTLKGLVAIQLHQFWLDAGSEYGYLNYVYPSALIANRSLLIRNEIENGQDLEKAKFWVDSAFNEFHSIEILEEAKSNKNNVEEGKMPIRSLAFPEKGGKLYSADGNGRIWSWDIDTRQVREMYDVGMVVTDLRLSPDGERMAVVTGDSKVSLIDNKENAVPRELTMHRGAVYDLVFLNDNSGFVTVGADKKIFKTSFAGKNSELIMMATIEIKTLEVSSDGLLVAASNAGEIFLVDPELTYKEQVDRLIYRQNSELLSISDLEFSHSGRFLAIGGNYLENGHGYVTLWDRESKTHFGPYQLQGFTGPVMSMEFSPDDALLAVSSADGTVRIWSMEEDEIFDLPIVINVTSINRLNNHWVFDVAFHPDGGSIMTASGDGIIRQFQLDVSEYINKLCTMLNRNMSDLEWRSYIADPKLILWEETCPELPKPEN